MSRRCFTTSAWSITTTPKQSDLRSTVPTPRATFSGHAASLEPQADLVWEAIALHTTPGIPQIMRPEIALTKAGVVVDVVGRWI